MSKESDAPPSESSGDFRLPGLRTTVDSIPWWQVDLGEEAVRAASSAVANKLLSQGVITEILERQFASVVGVKHAIATSSGSTALSLALLAAGARPGDAIICPAYTWIGTAHAAHLLGCKVELVDIQIDRPVLDLSKVPLASTNRRFALPVHMNGHATDIEGLKAKGYTVIEDAAQALGSKSNEGLLGCVGDMGCYSFSVSKIIGSGQGGMIVTNSDEFASIARRSRTHGITDVFAPEAWDTAGHNFRYNDIMASILLTQLKLLEFRISTLKEIWLNYSFHLENLVEVELVKHRSSYEFGPYVELRVHEGRRDDLIRFLETFGVGARRAFPPLTTAKYLGQNVYVPNALAWSKEVLYLPSGPSLSPNSIEYVCELIKGFFISDSSS